MQITMWPSRKRAVRAVLIKVLIPLLDDELLVRLRELFSS